jgi:hypothetical protein
MHVRRRGVEHRRLELRFSKVNAPHVKNVPGRRTFRPAEEICAARAIMRRRQDLAQMAAQHVQHMQKALTQMNRRLEASSVAALWNPSRGRNDPSALRRSREMYGNYQQPIEQCHAEIPRLLAEIEPKVDPSNGA